MSEKISPWHFIKPIRKVRNCQTNEIRLQIQDWDNECGQFWRDMTAEEIEAWKRFNNMVEDTE